MVASVRILDGAGWSVGLAAALFAFALLFLALDFQSPQIVLWTGQRAVGTEQNGLVTFYWHHHAYTATTPGTGSAKAMSVYFPPGNPDAAVAESIPDRLTAVALFAVPVAAGVVVLAVGLTRKRRWARRLDRKGSTSAFGAGLDEDFVARRLQERRGSQGPPVTRRSPADGIEAGLPVAGRGRPWQGWRRPASGGWPARRARPRRGSP